MHTHQFISLAVHQRFIDRGWLPAIPVMLLCLVIVEPLPVGAQTIHAVPAPAPAAGSMFIFPERVRLQNREFFAARRGLMFVPLNRSRADSDVVSVEFWLFPRSPEASPETPPLFLLNGGPGFPGLEVPLSRRGTFEEQLQPWLSLTDVVVVGQRGIGSSRPATVISQPPLPPIGQRDDPQAVREFRSALKSERQFWLDQGLDLSGYTVVEAAADVRDVARGLGFDKIVISGGSFGSHWGMALMKNHPELVARAVLHGLEGPDHTWDQPTGIWNVYKRVAEDASKAPPLRHMIPPGGLIEAIESLVDRASKAPLPVVINPGKSSETVVAINAAEMRELARGITGRLPDWPADVMEMYSGNLQRAARRVQALRRMKVTITRTASFWTLDSASGISPQRRQAFESDPALRFINPTFDLYQLGSPVWEVDLGDEFRQNFQSAIPTVLVHGTWDTSTPYENAVELAPRFDNGKLVTVVRGSHGAIGEARQADANFRMALKRFVVSGEMDEFPERVELPPPTWTLPVLDNEK
jgi:pimeloyl-ACP methyl ester carboxylesterase